MSLWGKSDSLYSTGTVSVNLTTKVATFGGGATLPAAATIEGAVVTITGKGSAVIKERTGNTTAVLHNTTGLDGTAISGVAYNISEQPVYLNEDSIMARAQRRVCKRLVQNQVLPSSLDHLSHEEAPELRPAHCHVGE